LQIEFSTQPVQETAADCLVVGIWEGNNPPETTGGLAETLGPRVQKLCEAGDFEGKPYESVLLYDVPGLAAPRVLLVGLGKPADCTATTISRAAGAAVRSLAKKKHDRVLITVLGGEASGISADERIRAIVSGALVAEGGQDLYRTKKTRKPAEALILAHSERPAAVEAGRIEGEAVRLAAELVNRPPADLFPASFCGIAEEQARDLPVQVEVLDAAALERERMGCILGVGRAAANEPRLLILRYDGAPKDSRRLAWVGKGVTFDSGGLSLKTSEGMSTMKCDMAGAATALAATLAVARRRLPVNLLCLAPLVENMPGGRAVKPGDVLRAKNGKTIEVLNTDAEGRLILADALSHAVDLGATHIVDLATLTGACVVALGTAVAGVMTNNEAFSREVLEAAKRTGERAWPLPMFEEYDDLIKSGVADMKNIGGKWAGAITAAKLLAQFVGETPWVHVDIAGPAFSEKETPYQDAGGTGVFARTLLELAQGYANKST
jgi:leucyl aminopeptidase